MFYNSPINVIKREWLKLLAGGVAGITSFAFAVLVLGFEGLGAGLIMFLVSVVISATLPKRFHGKQESRLDLCGLIFSYICLGSLAIGAIGLIGWGVAALFGLT